MSTTPHPSPGGDPGLTELLARAITDSQFRDQLFSNRDAAIKGYQLSPHDRAVVEHLEAREVEQAAQQLGQRGAAGGAVSLVMRLKVDS